jgi:hypothetical protein
VANLVPAERIERLILLIRGHKVLLDGVIWRSSTACPPSDLMNKCGGILGDFLRILCFNSLVSDTFHSKFSRLGSALIFSLVAD